MKKNRDMQRPRLRQPANVPGLPEPLPDRWPGPAGTLLLIHALLALAAVLLRRIWPLLDNLVSGNTVKAFVFGGLLMQGGLILLPTILVIAAGRLSAEDVVGSRPKAGSLILAATIGVPAAVVFQGLNNLLIYTLIKSGVDLPLAHASSSLVNGSILDKPLLVAGLIIAISVVLPALVEELMFRGVILSALMSTGAGVSAIIFQAIAFALFHNDPLFILPPFLAGLMLAMIRRSSQSLLPSILAHLSLNLSLLAIAPLLPQLTTEYIMATGSGTESLFYASLIAACVAAVALVPLLVIAGHGDANKARRSRRPVIWPADWKFTLAFLVLLATMVIETSGS